MARDINEIKEEFNELLEEFDCDNLTLSVSALGVEDKFGRTVVYLGLADDGHIALLSSNPEEDEHWEEFVTDDDDYLRVLNEILDLF